MARHPENSVLSRRSILVAGAGMTAAMTLGALASERYLPRPNILWLVSEDNNPFVGAYGAKLAHTPAIDGLAGRGLLYRHAYSTAPVCAPSRFAILTGAYAESYGPAHHMRADAKVSGILQTYPEYLRAAGYYCTNNAKTDYNCDIDPQKIWNDSSKAAHWRNRPREAPFMSVFNFESTHESTINKPTEGRIEAEDVKAPGHLPDTAEVRRDLASYYNRIELMDQQIGARLAELEADGLAEDTIVFYYSDNGGVLPRSKRFCYEEGLHCCLIIAVPPKYAQLAPACMGTEIERPVSLIDLGPTVLGLGGVAQPAHMLGTPLLGSTAPAPKRYVFSTRDRMDERYDMTRTVTDGRYRYIRNYSPHRPWGQHYSNAWLNKGYQSLEREYLAGRLSAAQARFFGPKPYEELYDLQADQMTNLVERPDVSAPLTALRSALDEHMLAINDNGFIPEGSPLEGYEQSRKPGAYPLQRIMALAESAARRDPSKIGTFEQGLFDANEVVRYWSAQGLLMLGRDALPARTQLLRALRKDPSPQIQVVVAEALAGLGESAVAVRALTELLDHASFPVRLQAINGLTFIGPAAKPALASIERAASEDDPEDWTVRAAARYLRLVLKGTYESSYPVFEWDWFRKWYYHRNG